MYSLQTSSLPFALRDNNGLLRSFRDSSIKNTYVVGKVCPECTGFPGRVIFRGSAQCIENVQVYAKQLYPQLDDAVNCGVRGCLYLPVLQGSYFVGVIELAMLVAKQSFADECEEIRRAFEAVNLAVSVPTLPDNKKKGKWKLDKLIPEVIEPYFYNTKLEDAAINLGVGMSTLRKATRNAGYDEWPHVERLRGSSSTDIQVANQHLEGAFNPFSARGPVHNVSTFAELVPEQTNCFPRSFWTSTCPSLGIEPCEAGTSTAMYHGVNQGNHNCDSKVEVFTEDNMSLSISDLLDESVSESIECLQLSDGILNLSDSMAGSSEVTTCAPNANEGGSLNVSDFNYLDEILLNDYTDLICDDSFPW